MLKRNTQHNIRIQFIKNFDSVKMETKRKSNTAPTNIVELQLLEHLQLGMKQGDAAKKYNSGRRTVSKFKR